MDADVIIVGGGLAGACCTLVLSRTEHVLLLEAERPAAGASGAAAGLVNPFMARRARPTWRLDEALEALHVLLEEAGAASLFRSGGVLRPARGAKQVRFFREAAEAHPEHVAWLPAGAARERHPHVETPHGALHVRSGGAVDPGAMARALLAAARRNGAAIRTGARVTAWDESDGAASVHVQPAAPSAAGAKVLRARHVLLALGQGYPAFGELHALGLRGVKGQTLRLRPPAGLDLAALPACSGFGYLVPVPASSETGDAALIAGSTYEHDFADLAPSDEATRRILRKTARMVPHVAHAEVVSARAGVRVTRASSRRPLAGPLPGRRRLWTLTALGSRGLLTAPLLARALPRYLRDPSSIPPEVRPSAA